MRRLLILVCLGISLAYSSSLLAAESNEDDRWGEGTANHNFYAAADDKYVQAILASVETNHLYNSTYAGRGGVKSLIRSGNIKAAIAELKYILDRIVNHPGALYLLCQVARQANDPSLPIEYYERAVRLYPGYAFTHAQYGTYLVDIGAIAAGMAQLQKAIVLDPKLASAHAGLARGYSKSGKPELAREAAQRARELGYKDKLLMQGAGDKSQSEE